MLDGEKDLREALGNDKADDFLMIWFVLRKMHVTPDQTECVVKCLFPTLMTRGTWSKIHSIGG